MAVKLVKDLEELIETYQDDINEDMTLKRALRRGLVMHLHSKVGRSEYAQTATSVAHILNVSNIPWSQNIEALKISICKLCKRISTFKKNLTRDWESIVQLLSENHISVDKVELPHQIPEESVTKQPYTEVLPPAKKMRGDCEKCCIQRMEISNLTAKLKSMQKQNQVIQLKDQLRKMKQAITHKHNIEIGLRNQLRKFKQERQVFLQKIKKLSSSAAKMKETAMFLKLKKVNKSKANYVQKYNELSNNQGVIEKELNAKVSELNLKVRELQRDNNDLGAQMEELRNCTTQTLDSKKDHKTYDIPIRKAIYHCLIQQVPVETAVGVIENVIKEMTGTTINFLQDKTTVSQMAYELGVLSDIQTGDILTSTDNITIAWDATSIDGSHINEVHICVPGSLYVLELNQLPGGTTEDYYTHTHN